MAPIFPFKSRLCSVGLVLLLVLLPFGAPSAQADSAAINPAVLVKDINTATRSAEPQFLSAVGNRLLFAADDGINGVNLWATDATGTGTFRLKAIKPLSPVVMSKGIGYFVASDGEHGAELWRTDGTAAGTQLVADINPGAADSYPYAFAEFNGLLFFFATTGDIGNSVINLWRSDGTAAGTRLLTERIATAKTRPYLLVPLKGKLFIVLSDSGTPFQLWGSDGTENGTTLLKAFPGSNVARTTLAPQEGNPGPPPDPPFNPRLTEINGTIFFFGDDGIHGMTSWKSDGTPAGTIPTTDLIPAAASSLPVDFIKFQDALFFITADGLWRSQGSGASAQLIKPGLFAQLVVAGNLLFSIGIDEHGAELWRSDGTSAGTVLVKDINPGPAPSSIAYLTALNGKVFFRADGGIHGWDLWQSDGTAAGTTLVKGSNGYLYFVTIPFTVAGGRIFFIVQDDQHGFELWRSDGTTTGTVLVDDINQQPASSQPAQIIPIGEQILFTAQDNLGGRHWWWSNGTSEGTQRLDPNGLIGNGIDFIEIINTDLYVVADSQRKLWRLDSLSGVPTLLLEVSNGQITASAVMGNRLFFLINSTEPQSNGLWQSDGTAAGTQLIKAVQAERELVVNNNTLYFVAFTAEAGVEVWKSDGTPPGTMLLKDINPGEGGAEPEGFINVNGTLFFTAFDGSHGEELWKSDGTTDGTVLVKDINPDLGSAPPHSFVKVNGALFFIANDGRGTALWKSDGTVDGTVFVKLVFSPTFYNASFHNATVFNNRLFFTTNSGKEGEEVWVTDGTEAGTFMLKNIQPDNQSLTNPPSWLTVVNGKLLFVANDVTTHGEELWISDGTTAGTQLLKDINPGPAHGSPSALTNINGVVLFAATDGSGQGTLWRTDGTAAGTQLLQAIAPEQDFFDGGFVVVGSNIFFSADDGTTGYELWKIPLTSNQATLNTSSLVSAATDGVGQLQIDYGNQSSTLQRQVSLTAVLDAQLTYLSSSGPVTPTIQGNTLVWQLPDLAPLASGVIDLRVQAPTAPLGTRYPVTLTLSTVTGDAAPVQSVANVEVMMAAHSYLPVIRK